eukprot:Unigene11568_Nuclearia_a/m.35255 Unigene11568_Nuclearia_a/g.35255  ORF Unigene11568_Nuclearia_a/g.35255 Unigene11568_Nuclearia_a/m.35255 type:complete len:213 (+) Unigene11568_Nuclearia_a:862-1500(+)
MKALSNMLAALKELDLQPQAGSDDTPDTAKEPLKLSTAPMPQPTPPPAYDDGIEMDNPPQTRSRPGSFVVSSNNGSNGGGGGTGKSDGSASSDGRRAAGTLAWPAAPAPAPGPTPAVTSIVPSLFSTLFGATAKPGTSASPQRSPRKATVAPVTATGLEAAAQNDSDYNLQLAMALSLSETEAYRDAELSTSYVEQTESPPSQSSAPHIAGA